MTFDDIDDLGDDPFKPTITEAPKKRGRPAGQTKPKPKVAAKPRWRLNTFAMEEITNALMTLAYEIDPDCRRSKAAQLKVAAELLEMIENKKA